MINWSEANPRCQAIAASAGSGKTFKLCHRIIGLLASGESPESIIALTFSRKAAGEILDDVMKYICEGASSEEKAKFHSEQAKCDATQDDYRTMLKQMIDALPKLKLQTLDSFTISTVGAFPFELGLSGAMEVIDENSSVITAIKDKVLQDAVEANSKIDAAFKISFFKYFKEATAGKDSKNIRDAISGFIDKYHEKFISSPDGWGDQNRIWGSSYYYQEVKKCDELAEKLYDYIDAADFGHKTIKNQLTKFVEKVVSFQPGDKVLSGALDKQLFENAIALLNGKNVSFISFGKEFCFPTEVGKMLALLILNVVDKEFQLALTKTRGISKIIDCYERQYNLSTRLQGKMTFQDAQLILAEGARSGGDLLSHAPESKLFIDYRLDSQIKHWLLDEFQDTSDLQWQIIANLIDEVVQDVEEERSFFYVGDVKQAIYQWRSGNPLLFSNILNQYAGSIVKDSLTHCRRQSKAVLATVNQVFGNISNADFDKAGSLPVNAVARWNYNWEDHLAMDDAPMGYCSYVEAPSDDELDKNENVYRKIVALLNEVKPLEKGLSVAILVRGNKKGSEITQFIRANCPNMEVVQEGKAEIKTSMLVNLLLSLLKAAACPADTLAWKHLLISPLLNVMENKGVGERLQFTEMVLEQIADLGIKETLTFWGELLLPILVKNVVDFERLRLHQLLTAATAFESGKAGTIIEFLDYVDHYRFSEKAKEGTIRVMTIHQSKGLGFDMVILPELQPSRGGNMTKATSLDMISGGEDDNSWSLAMPNRDFAAVDEKLSAAIEEADSASCYEAICLWYVAMTRAKKAMYMIAPPQSKTTSSSITFRRILDDTLAGSEVEIIWGEESIVQHFESGNADWFTDVDEINDNLNEDDGLDLAELLKPKDQHRKRKQLKPSDVSSTIPAVMTLSGKSRHALAVGNAVHEIMENVQWFTEQAFTTAIDDWFVKQPNLDEKVEVAVRRHLDSIGHSESFKLELTKPAGNVEVWTEKSFEAIIDDGWVSGIFDRVVIFRDENGNAVKAEILDYKTDNLDATSLEGATKHHQPQLQMYRRILQKMTNLSEDAIDLKLLFTHNGTVYKF